MSSRLPYLTFICLVSTLGGLLFGYDMIVISGTQDHVRVQFQLSSVMQGQFTNMAVLGCLLGVVVVIVLGDRLCRKNLLISSSMLLLLSAAWCGFAMSITGLFLARFIGGVGVGIASVISPLYISEASPPNLRGRMVTLFQLMINIGVLLAAVVNAQLQAMSGNSNFHSPWLRFLFRDEIWRGMFLMEVVPAALFLLLCLFLPLSPRWLVKENRMDDARAVLRRIRKHEVVEAELLEIHDAVAHEDDCSFVRLFQRGLRKALIIGLFLTVIGDLSGITAVFYYGPGIFERAGFAVDGAMNSFITISLFVIAGTVMASLLIDRVGRKPLLYISNTGCMLSLLGTGWILQGGSGHERLLVVLICTFVLCFGLGLGPIKFVIINEIFPTRLRGRASAVCTLGLWGAISLVSSVFPVLRDGAGMAVCFLAFGAVLILVYPFLAWVLPETKGRSLEALEQIWNPDDRTGSLSGQTQGRKTA
jgi:MFS transporter, SP family, arabinose:H+ symporter